MRQVLIIGIGNLLLRDEGVGVHAIRALGERWEFPQGVSLLDGGTAGLDLLPRLEGKGRLMLVDAVDFNAPPGTVKKIEGGDVKVFLDMKFSVHQIGVPDMLFAAAFSGVMPPVICLVGIQPERIETGLELSPALEAAMPEFLGVIIRKLASWGIEARAKAEAFNSHFE